MKNPFFHALLDNNNPNKGKKPYSIVEMAYTWFGRPNWVYSATANKWWVGGVTNGRQFVVEHDLITGKFTPVPVGEILEDDDHNQAQLLIRASDSRIFAVYAGHNSAEIGYKISTNPLDGKSWGAQVLLNDPESGKKSYVSPYQASNGDIYLFYRGTFYELDPDEVYWYYRKSTDNGATFGTAVKIYDASPEVGYLISYQDGDKVHFCATPGNPDTALNPLQTYHFYIDLLTGSLHNTIETLITAPATTSNMTLVDTVESGQTSWILDIITKNGFPRILYAFFPRGTTGDGIEEGKDRRLKYAEWNGTTWENREICQTQIGYIGTEINVNQHYYTGVSRFCQSNPDILFVPRKIEYDPQSILELWKFDLRTDKWEQLTFNSKYENWRPISIPSPYNNLVWMNNVDYYDFTDFKILLKTITVDTA